MANQKVSYRNVIVSTLIFTLLFFLIVNIMYYVFNGQTMFTQLMYFEWVEYAIGTGIMAAATFIVELVRNFLGRRKTASVSQ